MINNTTLSCLDCRSQDVLAVECLDCEGTTTGTDGFPCDLCGGTGSSKIERECMTCGHRWSI